MSLTETADNYTARRRLRMCAENWGLLLTGSKSGYILEESRSWWWPFRHCIAEYRLWQTEGVNRLRVWRRHDTTDLRLWLGNATLMGWHLIVEDKQR